MTEYITVVVSSRKMSPSAPTILSVNGNTVGIEVSVAGWHWVANELVDAGDGPDMLYIFGRNKQ